MWIDVLFTIPGFVLGPSQVHLDRLLDGDQGLAAIEDLVLQLDDGQCAPVDIIKETFFYYFNY
jgi:hypothetical protein